MNSIVETKVAAGSFAGILTGLIAWALVAYVPAFRTGLPAPVAALIPVAVAWLIHSVTAYMAPHTPRELPPVHVLPPGTTMTPLGPVGPVTPEGKSVEPGGINP